MSNNSFTNDKLDNNNSGCCFTNGDPAPVLPVNSKEGVRCNCIGPKGVIGESGTPSDQYINLDSPQTKLLKTVVEFLRQVSEPLYSSNNHFLSSASKDLADQLSDRFYIG